MSDVGGQAMGIVLIVAGPQNTAVQAHQAGTEHARIGVRIGRVLIYLTDSVITNRVASAWQDYRGFARACHPPHPEDDCPTCRSCYQRPC